MKLKTHSRFRQVKYLDHTSYLNCENLYMLVHPFFDEDAVAQDYNENLKDILGNHEGPILTLEDEVSFDSTVKFVKDTFPLAARFFIKTESCDCKPHRMNENKFFDFIRELSDNKPIGLMGGYYNGNICSGLSCGCLGSLDFIMKERNFKTYILEGCIYVRDY